ncbi:MAG: DUF5915 domain-containing protein, partial [Phototrophicaceae bacterium]
NWYVRLTRDRFWEEDPAAFATLYEVLTTVSKLLAPAMPFVSDELYRNLEGNASSVHLAEWPTFDAALIDQKLLREMNVAQRLVNLGRSAREAVNINIRQPLARANFVTPNRAESDAVANLADIILLELNVKGTETLADAGGFINYSLNPIPKFLGRKFGKEFPRVQKALREGDAADVRRYAETLLKGETLTLTLDGDVFEMTGEEVEVIRDLSGVEGYAIAEEGGYLVALDTRLDEALIAEGFANEIKRRVQVLRKDAGFAIEDRIVISYQASERLTSIIEQYRQSIMSETLAQELVSHSAQNGFHSEAFEATPDAESASIKSESFTLGVKRI